MNLKLLRQIIHAFIFKLEVGTAKVLNNDSE